MKEFRCAYCGEWLEGAKSPHTIEDCAKYLYKSNLLLKERIDKLSKAVNYLYWDMKYMKKSELATKNLRGFEEQYGEMIDEHYLDVKGW